MGKDEPKLKIVIATNAFKGCATASEASKAIEFGVKRACRTAKVITRPVADGGDGLLDVAASALGADLIHAEVTGPLGDATSAAYALTPDGTAIIEMALASGIALLDPDRLDPLKATTRGTGELLLAAIEAGAKRIIVGLGGSATNDGGLGFADALGFQFFDSEGERLAAEPGSLGAIKSIDASNMDPRLATVRIECASDVTNPLCGPEGASAVFGPQKGASTAAVGTLDKGLQNLANTVARDLNIDASNKPGAGAAGGLGFGIMAFAGGTIRSGIDLVMELVGLEAALQGADLCITGEGRIDDQTQFGKAPAGVARLAKQHGVPCIALAGSIGSDLGALPAEGLTASFALADGPMTLDQSMADTERLLERAAEQVVRLYSAAPTA
ncbi:MAG: glycerate kinase [Pseudomonadota bacterium]